jgi:tRNA 5-methylaminomethyl-2-thiouridine biosynthesis bifunctional protein
MKIIVVGAGLAGSACAHALALRGYDVTVLDAVGTQQFAADSGFEPAPSTSPSSSLPVALMAPHHGAASNPITQLSHLGIAATLQAARDLLVPGRDWQHCGTLQRAGKLGPQAHWFSGAAWIKPAAVVAAWLAHPRITLLAGAAVHRLQHKAGSAGSWQAVDAQGSVLAQGDAAVLANAYQAKALLSGLGLQHAADALHQVAGQVVYGPWTTQWQALWPQLLPELAQLRANDHAAPTEPLATDYCAINGNGHFIPAIPGQGDKGETIWLSGSTYEHDAPHKPPNTQPSSTPHTPQVTAQGLATNLQRLQQLIPAAADLLAAQHSAGLLRGWAGTRCTTSDRLPMVGAVSQTHAPDLYTCTAMGSRGLSFAAVCGQHLAWLIATGTHQPLPDSLCSAIDASRFSPNVH